ncbi:MULTISPECIES: hypothetical protein [unclassified Pseudomonas]|uniref:hypothetical protein n=1 Tax=unclassified Pseudomonas TaxID=196821 RepID=UPI002447BCFC|nr:MULTISPECIES: hypothetical protein [unclassified Pseudomonas]MDG9928549.1 hypothetical protein [Pseudomonas sp. GD04042]MDH0482719.1 hypothetical protein [Pseudomonas sp. GD04015]MDH0604579.1 hypothetical protein [Pseudomonas sp. GD03869]
MTLRELRFGALAEAFRLLPARMESQLAELHLVAFTLQEDPQQRRRQWPTGPARGLWQFELGSEQTRGGVWGIYMHPASREHLRAVAAARGVPFEPEAIYKRLQHDDVLAACCARLLMFTDPHQLPERGDVEGAWQLYLRTWRPGAHTTGTPGKRRELRQKFAVNYAASLEVVR